MTQQLQFALFTLTTQIVACKPNFCPPGTEEVQSTANATQCEYIFETETGDPGSSVGESIPPTSETTMISSSTSVLTTGSEPSSSTSTTEESTATSESSTSESSTTGGDWPTCSNESEKDCCGNGMQEADEVCDDLTQANDMICDHCDATCQIRMSPCCGDQNVDPGETCDDDNTVSTDGCVVCQDAFCGDGYVWTGLEECDHAGDVTNNGTCSSDCKVIRRAFVSSVPYSLGESGFSGMAGADEKCNLLAQQSNNPKVVGKTFKAWLSVSGLCTGDNCASSRFMAAKGGANEGVYMLADDENTVLAKGWNNLKSSMLEGAQRINVTEKKLLLSDTGTFAWTGTLATGTPSSSNPADAQADCDDWTSQTPRGDSGMALVGGVSSNDGMGIGKWTAAKTEYCNISARIYCLEDTP